MSALVEEEEEEMPILVEATFKQIPVSIMTGFLGSGKTTLLNYLLRKQHGKRIAIIENEFSGGLGIENMIAKSGVDGGDMGGARHIVTHWSIVEVKIIIFIIMLQISLNLTTDVYVALSKKICLLLWNN